MQEKLIINTIFFEIEVNILPLFTKIKKYNRCLVDTHRVVSVKLYVNNFRRKPLNKVGKIA